MNYDSEQGCILKECDAAIAFTDLFELLLTNIVHSGHGTYLINEE